MGFVKRFDHVGITVADLDMAVAFFVGLGLRVEGTTGLEGDFLDTVIGGSGARTRIVMLGCPGGQTTLELSHFEHPAAIAADVAPKAHEIGLRSVAFEVDDLAGAVSWAAGQGFGLIGGIGEYEDAWRMAYVRGPDGIIVALAQRLVHGEP